MEEVRHRAIVRISHELLRQMLFPDGAKIIAVMLDTQDLFGRNDFVCVVEHPDLPITGFGEVLPDARPLYTQHCNGDIENEIPSIEFTDWGLRE